MENVSTEEFDDEAFARQLQEQFNAEVAQGQTVIKDQAKEQEQLLKDMELAKKLMEEGGDIESEKPTESGTEKQAASGEEKLVDVAKKQQEELDILFAMKLQESLYAHDDFQKKAPPQPSTYFPSANFVRHKHESNRLPPTAEAVKRITSDIKEILLSKHRDIFVSPDEEDITHIQSLIVGPPDTPYAFGFFHFDMLFPHDYPWKPPKVQLITTDSGRTRFNPNLYSNGKVCLSILGTWSGPGWTQVQTILSTLLSIQSLMHNKPYHNEPGYEQERKSGDVEKYNRCIQHETIRVAVCGMLENPTCQDQFREEIEEIFLEHFDHYVKVCKENVSLDGKEMSDPFGERRGVFKYTMLLKQLETIKEKLDSKRELDNTKEEEVEEAVSNPSEEEVNESPMLMDPPSEAPLVPLEALPADPVPTSETQSSTSPFEDTSSSMIVSETVPSTVEIQSDPMDADPTPEKEPQLVQQPKETKETKEETKETQGTEQVVQETTQQTTQKAQEAPQEVSSETKKEDSDLAFAKQLANQLTVEASMQFNLDEEFAKQLQEQMYSEEMGGQYSKYSSFSGSREPQENILAANASFTPIKPPPLSELMKEDAESDKEDSDIVCLVCHTSPKEYIILPSCQQPHIYCMACATKMVQQGPTVNRYNIHRRGPHKRGHGPGTSMQCVLCSAVSTLDPQGGLAGLRRRKKRKMEQKTNLCAQHNEEFGLFCMDCVELICFMCGDAHSRHDVEALDVAQGRVKSEIEKHMSTLELKRSKLEIFTEEIRKGEPKVAEESEKVQKEMRGKFAELRKLIDEKEKEMEEAIKRLETSKRSTITSEATRAKQRIEKIDESISSATSAISETEPLTFLQKMEDIEEQVRHECLVSDPEVKQQWFQLPQVQLQRVEQVARSLTYGVRNPGFHGMIFDPEEDSPEEGFY